MRCPDCGYLLLDPQSHCPKCEKTLQEARAKLAISDNAAAADPPAALETLEPPMPHLDPSPAPLAAAPANPARSPLLSKEISKPATSPAPIVAGEPPPPRSLEDDLAELSISLSRRLQVPVMYRQTTTEVEDATGSVFRELEPQPASKVSGAAAPRSRPFAPAADEISEWSMPDIAGPAPRPQGVGKTPPPAISAPVPSAINVRREAAVTAASPSLGVRTGEIPPPKSYMTRAAERAGEATAASPASRAAVAAIPQDLEDLSSGRWNTTGWVDKTQPPQALLDEESDSLLAVQVPAPTQISFPSVPRAEPPWPEPVPAETSAEFPSAEIVGEASTRLSARLRGGKATLRGKALGRRLIAFALDNVLTLGMALGFIFAGTLAAGVPLAIAPRSGGPGWGVFLTLIVTIRFVLDACYQIGYLALQGRTPGKRLVGLRVLGEGVAERPTLAQAALRWAWAYALTFGICWGYLWVRRDREGRALHDRKAHTRIIPV